MYGNQLQCCLGWLQKSVKANEDTMAQAIRTQAERDLRSERKSATFILRVAVCTKRFVQDSRAASYPERDNEWSLQLRN